MADTHHLKIKYEYAKLHFRGLKDWEIREDDRDYKTGDKIVFSILEFGFMYTCTITNIFRETQYGLQEGYVILSLNNVINSENETA